MTTIIILLILAGITISQLSNSGLFDKSKIAKEKSENAQEKEELEIAKASNEIDNYINGNRNIDLSDEVKEYIDNKIFGVELWTNQSPNQVFAPQTVAINDIMSYKRMRIIYKGYYNIDEFSTSEIDIVKLNQTGRISRQWGHPTAAGCYVDSRNFTIVENGIQFDAGDCSQIATSDNGRIVPYKIIEIK